MTCLTQDWTPYWKNTNNSGGERGVTHMEDTDDHLDPSQSSPVMKTVKQHEQTESFLFEYFIKENEMMVCSQCDYDNEQ